MTPDIKTLVPVATGLAAAGAGVMAYNAAAHLSHWSKFNNSAIGTSDLNFLGQQDMFIGAALFVGLAALARATDLYAHGNKGESRNYFKFAGAMIASAGLYALTVGIFGNHVQGSKIGNLNEMDKMHVSIFSLAFGALTVMGAALMVGGHKTSTSNVVKYNIDADMRKSDSNININSNNNNNNDNNITRNLTN